MEKISRVMIVKDCRMPWYVEKLPEHLARHIVEKKKNNLFIQFVRSVDEATAVLLEDHDFNYLVFPQKYQHALLSLVDFFKLQVKIIVLQRKKTLRKERNHWVGPMLILFKTNNKKELDHLFEIEPDRAYFS